MMNVARLRSLHKCVCNINRYAVHKRLLPGTRYMSTEAATLTTPPSDTEEKVYPERVEQLVAEISRMTLLEVAELNECLKKRLNIADTPVMMAGPAAAPAAAEEEEAEEQVAQKGADQLHGQAHSFDAAKKVPLIKELKRPASEGMNLVQAKKFVESAPAVVKADVSKADAEKLKEILEAAGAVCVIE
ncbi:39S ribosomal protein L12, mitochondrial-like [Pollicipes pollicipes]|uniref:39S ribosomal protein L12, mitochondrial-like n=1 Tax=Pollicipes pollicipes TaxID=41117 RepID=UPI0018850AB2|nr:39S ribosomal protein L12, mitochondrial-like [Pollicipes pollicipes]